MLPANYRISIEPNDVQIDAVHQFLCYQSYWHKGVSREVVERAIAHSVVVSLFYHDEQVGFARAATDRTIIAYICDVYVLEAHRKKGLAKAMLQALLNHPELTTIYRWLLRTSDAHGLYQQLGFHSPERIETIMELTKAPQSR